MIGTLCTTSTRLWKPESLSLEVDPGDTHSCARANSTTLAFARARETIMHMNARYESVIPASTRQKSADLNRMALIQGNKPATLEAPAKSDSRRRSKRGKKRRLRGSKGANFGASIGISRRERVIGESSEQMSEAGSPPADTRRWMVGGWVGGREGGKEGRTNVSLCTSTHTAHWPCVEQEGLEDRGEEGEGKES